LKSFRDIQVDETNILAWQGLILPVSFNKLKINSQSIFLNVFLGKQLKKPNINS
jgi:hypothetical protein